ncbi:hypothetical protein H8N03_22385 [Ramlibacter sp. USB13]|uniref:Uncharacterized protein n=1 Tax=Ramlibacter cellulosilyticus TaxID=2764187 RepID=A0A923MVC0_9BURK|nr:hypothetical protein [Ramlibacter cellulosilyticus]MBC5785706.1 hypothetical protein [Ramlibacter cellulosilyticus]
MAGALIDRLVAALFGREDAAPDQALVAEMTDLVVDTVEPRVRAQRRYREKLEPCIRTTIACLREVGRAPLEPLLLARARWGEDRRLNAFFATAEDVPAFLGRSKELRSFFAAQPGVHEAFALLGMRREEKTVFAPRLQGGMLMEDVAQTTVDFTGHRLVGLAADEAQARLEVGKRMVLRLAQVALGRILEIDRQGLKKEQHKAYLSTRLRFLKLAQDGMQGIVDDPATIAQQVADVKRELDAAVKDYIEVKSSLVTLDGYIAQIEEVFAHPERHVALTRTELRMNRMNVKADPGQADAPEALTLAELRIGDRPAAVIAFVRCPRAEMPAEQDLLARAERFL